ncbi:hypothetical protein KL935_001372 [Ogataea polymorpha]|uniref:Uncharacterized protein n=2 Tax=Ogataea polymorpha TaxID=460523 RepID=A0A9P8P0P3_9ASCO|nr:hypothetical protein KL937_000786 [Ogataea polymorpha]KAG7895054.1 hypothetical protein KL908_001404 [Ogataea polymorpha]KAG7902464.1 hypothetical protein KL935_001372 [Ogataea polymorpha]KAG7911548.1 hypothetical protein KL906_000869 [Ogataea polymorpha]KAG7919232.1 hypothetical protein KL927_001361 [Ogataea polymorpha]
MFRSRPRLLLAAIRPRRPMSYWNVGANINHFRQAMRSSDSPSLGVRLLYLGGIVAGLNLAFNSMLFVLTNLYMNELETISWGFGFRANSEFKNGLANEMIINDPKKANQHYSNALKLISKANGLEEDELLGYQQLDRHLQQKDISYISSYSDLVLRYALTLGSKSRDRAVECITYALKLQDRYGEQAQTEVGAYSLRNLGLRYLADVEKEDKRADKAINLLIEAIRVMQSHEFSHSLGPDEIPPTETCSSQLVSSIVELCVLYASTREPIYMNKSFKLLVSLLRNLENEARALAKSSQPDAKNVKSDKIPLVKLQLSEILWYKGQHGPALEFAKESALEADLYSRDNANSAKISKVGYQNLATMYSELGDNEAAELCLLKANRIEIPVSAFATPSRTVRNTVLRHYLGPWSVAFFA